MKRLAGIALMLLVFAAVTTTLYSQDNKAQKKSTAQQVNAPCCPKFADANGDGICDNKAAGCKEAKGCKTKCDGKNVKGANFVDANGDGVCDNFKDGKCTSSCCKQGKQKAGCGKSCGSAKGNHGCGGK